MSGLTWQAILTGHTNSVDAVAWSPDSIHLASSGKDWHVIIWDARDPGHPVEAAAPLAGHSNTVSALGPRWPGIRTELTWRAAAATARSSCGTRAGTRWRQTTR